MHLNIYSIVKEMKISKLKELFHSEVSSDLTFDFDFWHIVISHSDLR